MNPRNKQTTGEANKQDKEEQHTASIRTEKRFVPDLSSKDTDIDQHKGTSSSETHDNKGKDGHGDTNDDKKQSSDDEEGMTEADTALDTTQGIRGMHL